MRGAGFSTDAARNVVKLWPADSLGCNEAMAGRNGDGYVGCSATTRSGRACVDVCRNPTPNDVETIWCETTDPEVP